MADSSITREEFQAFKLEVMNEIKALLSQRQLPLTQRWLKSQHVRKLLPISEGTLLHLRVSGQLPFSKLRGVIVYDIADVEKMIEAGKSQARVSSAKKTDVK